MNKQYVYLVVIVCLLSFGLVQCGAGTTETGNPAPMMGGFEGEGGPDAGSDIITEGVAVSEDDDDDEDSQDDSQINSSLHLTDLVLAVCERLESCFDDVDQTTCSSDLKADPNILLAFGASPDRYKNFAQAQAEADINADAFDSCMQSLESLTCVYFDLAAGYAARNDLGFGNVCQSIPQESCGEVLDSYESDEF